MNSPEKVIEENLTCPICLDLMNIPTTAICGHNFCYDCLFRSNLECGVCRRRLTQDEVTINFQLKEIIIAFKEFKLNRERQQTPQMPIYFNTYNIFRDNSKKILTVTSEYSTNNPMKLKNRGIKSRRNYNLWKEESNDHSNVSQYGYKTNGNLIDTPRIIKNDRLDVMMNDLELMITNANYNRNLFNYNSLDSHSVYDYLNYQGKKFKYK